uniref:Uncharacterized protein n=1 Tax=Magnetospirillum gryphiswaldense TaxID=55518 RepID=Q3BKG2_9PROT|nr:hypothetical protein mgI415 [Magnetospirillum gryphiswaldense MSR-1]
MAGRVRHRRRSGVRGIRQSRSRYPGAGPHPARLPAPLWPEHHRRHHQSLGTGLRERHRLLYRPCRLPPGGNARSGHRPDQGRHHGRTGRSHHPP